MSGKNAPVSMDSPGADSGQPLELASAQPSILVVRFSSMGDILLATPVLRAIRSRWPHSSLSFLTREAFAPLLRGNPYLDELITLKEGASPAELKSLCRSLGSRRWHLLADLHTSLRSSLAVRLVPADFSVSYTKHRLKRSLLIYARLDLYGPGPPQVPERYAACLAPFGVRLDDKPCELFLGPEDRLEFQRLAGDFTCGSSGPLAVAPGAAWPVKRWPAERFARAAADLAGRHGLKVILLGADQDWRACAEVENRLGPQNCLNLAGQLSLRGSAAAVAASALLLTNDTGLMHVATAVDTPVVAVFGPTTRHFGYFPYRARAAVIEEKLACRPCTHNGRRRCPLLHFGCMNRIDAERVVLAAEGLLGK